MPTPNVIPIKSPANCGASELPLRDVHHSNAPTLRSRTKGILEWLAISVWRVWRGSGSIEEADTEMVNAGRGFPVIVDMNLESISWPYDDERSVRLLDRMLIVLNAHSSVSRNALGDLSGTAAGDVSPFDIRYQFQIPSGDFSTSAGIAGLTETSYYKSSSSECQDGSGDKEQTGIKSQLSRKLNEIIIAYRFALLLGVIGINVILGLFFGYYLYDERVIPCAILLISGLILTACGGLWLL